MAENTWPETHGRKSREREEEREEEKEVHGGGEQPEERRKQAGDAWGLGNVMYYSRRNTTRVYATRARKPRTLTSPRRVGGSPAATAKRRRNKPHQQVPTQPWG